MNNIKKLIEFEPSKNPGFLHHIHLLYIDITDTFIELLDTMIQKYLNYHLCKITVN